MRTRSLAGAGATALAFGLLTSGPAWAHDRVEHRGGGGVTEVTTTKDTADADPYDGICADAWGACSLRAAIQHANASGGGTVDLDGGHYRLSIGGRDEDAGATGDLDVRSAITLDGDGATVDAGRIDRVLHVLAGASLRLDDVTLTGGDAQGTTASGNSGGGVLNAGTLVVDRSTITANRSVRAGGGIEAEDGSRTTVDRSTLSRNATGAGPGNGGGLHLTGTGTVGVERTHVVHNTAAAEGGGLWNSAGGTMTVSRSVVSGNSASGDDAENGGGGLYNDGGSLTVTRSHVEGNVADGTAGSGGGILNNGGTLVVERTTLRGNDAQRAGGGIEAAAGRTTVSRSDITGNSTGANPGNGGGVHLGGDGVVRIDRGSVTGNRAANEGGGLWNSEEGTFTVNRTEIRDNVAPVGPNVYQDGTGQGFTVDGRTVPPGGN